MHIRKVQIKKGTKYIVPIEKRQTKETNKRDKQKRQTKETNINRH
jgi:hypothetical protein